MNVTSNGYHRYLCEIGNLPTTYCGDGKLGNNAEEVRCDRMQTMQMSRRM